MSEAVEAVEPVIEVEVEAAEATFAAPASQDELDRIIGERLARERAKYADYEELKQKVTEAENANKTELELAQARIAELQGNLLNSAREAAAARHGIPADYLDLLVGDTPEAIEEVAVKLGALAKPVAAAEPASPPPYSVFDPAQSGAPAPDEAAVKEAFARQLFGIK
jgi:hypothetical protein